MIRRLKDKVDFKLITIIAVVYFFIEMVLFLKFLYFKSQGKMGTGMEISYYFFRIAIVDWITVVLFMSVIAVSTKHFFESNVKWGKVIVIHVLFALFLTIFIYGIGYVIDSLFNDGQPDQFMFQKILDGIVSVSDSNILIYMGLTGIIYTYYYFYKNKDIQNQQTLLKNELLNSNLKLLRNQLRPHFYFNALNNISALITGKPQDAQTALANLGDLMRELLNFSEDSMVPLEKELDISLKYINLMQLKYQGNLIVNFDIEEGLETALVPSLFIQPLVENAIKHGMNATHRKITIKLQIHKNKDAMYFLVKNNGEPLDSKKSTMSDGTGLNNLNERLSILYPNRHSFDIYNEKPSKQVVVKAMIPLKYEEKAND